MIAVWLAIGAVAGYALGLAVVPILARRRPIATATFRGAPVAHRLDELIEAVRAAALRVEVRPDGFDVLAQPCAFRDHAVSVRVSDAASVTLASLAIRDTGGYDLSLVVALALVPLFGPITVTEADGESYLIDGTRDQHVLRHDKGARVTAKLREIVARMRAT